MGQSQSHRHSLSSSDDRMSLFIPCNGSITSLTGDNRYEDILTRNYHRNFKTCRKLSKLKKSFSECFRTKFSHLQEVDDIDVSPPDSEIISAQRPSSEMSKTVVTESRVRRLSDSSTIVNQSLPRDIQEIHIQLTELKKLLSRPDFVYEHQTERKDKSCQTDKIDMINGDHLYHRECMITKLQDQLHNLRANLDNRNKIAESFAKELTILRAQQSRRSVEIEPKVLDPFIGLLKSIRNDKKLNNLDLDKFDEGINLIMSLSMSHRNQVDKTNIAIINPCSQTISETSKEDPSQYLIISQTADSQTTDDQPSSFITDFKGSTEKAETKMVFFLGESTTPYLSNIPLSSSQITLAKVKEYTSSMLSKERNLRYFFKTINSDFGPAKEEIVRDQDIVPHIDGKILVFIQ